MVAIHVPWAATDWTVRGSNPGGGEIFRPSIPALGPTQPPCTKGTGGKVRPGRAANHSPPSSVEVLEE